MSLSLWYKKGLLVGCLIFIAFSLIGCFNRIDGNKVSMDDNTHIYTYKDNGQKATGKVIFYDGNVEKQIKNVRTVKDGFRIGEGYGYFPNGQLAYKINYKAGLEDGAETRWLSNGKLASTCEWRRNSASLTSNQQPTSTAEAGRANVLATFPEAAFHAV